MRKLISFFLFSIMATCAFALDIPQGTFFFDNSKTLYSKVKFVYGSDSSNETYVVSMTLEKDALWKVTMASTVSNMYRYTFADTSLPDGKINDSFSNVKEYISKTLIENRTATTDAAIPVGYTFVPSSGDNWAQGSWMANLDSTHPYSSSLPLLHINTTDGQAITSKDVYLTGTYYLENMGLEGYESFGSAEAPLPLEIKGRGNYTWSHFDKKPYRIKLGAKAALLGMTKSKHFVLLAHADDDMAFLRNTVGFELSRLMELPYTPAQQPVEVMLNGEYIGLYMLTENIRVDADRVNIVEQADNATDSEEITGGWLVEIDNYEEDPQIRITEGNGSTIRFTYKTPEILSTEQSNYLTQQVTLMNSAIYVSDKSSTAWEGYIDVPTLAKFYIVQEIMDNAESFHGSCYLYKDKGIGKWYFGPVWDFGNSFHRSTDKFIYTDSPFGQTWIGEIAKFPHFQSAVSDIWKNFKGNKYWTISSFIDNFISQINTAAQYNAQRWPQYGNSNLASAKANFNNYLTQKVAWLVKQWGEGITGVESPIAANIILSANGNGELHISCDYDITSVALYSATGSLVALVHPQDSSCTIKVSPGVFIAVINTASGDSFHKKILIR